MPFLRDQPPRSLPARPQVTIPDGVSLFGVLVRDLNFKKSFFRSKKKALDFEDGNGKSHKVRFFGTAGALSDGFSSAVKVLHLDVEKKSFVLKIATKTKGESLVIYQPPVAVSFQKGIEEVREAMKTPFSGRYGSLVDGRLHKFDIVKIPYLKLESETEFGKLLKGARHYPKKKPRQIVSAYQITKFELFEKGARVRVETGAVDGPFGSPPERVQYVRRQFVCDRPFFVYAWKEEARWPYFAAWIDGVEALEQFR